MGSSGGVAALNTLERQVGDKRYLLLVNDEEAEMGLTVNLGRAEQARNLLSGEVYRAEGGALKLKLKGYGAALLEVG